MKRTITLFLVLILNAGCTIPSAQFYSGPAKPETEVASIWFSNYADFVSGPQIYVIGVDERNFEKQSVNAALAYVEPGKHTVKVTFNDTNNYLIPALINQTVFQGWYDIEFVAKPGKKYLPIFNMAMPKKEQINEMCIVELDLNESISASRKVRPYAGCAKPNIRPTSENMKICQYMEYTPVPQGPLNLTVKPVTVEEFCTHKIDKQQ